MPEGSTIVLMKEQLLPYIGKDIILTQGKTNFDLQALKGQTLKDIRLLGKQTF